jgi:hypothetical protein
MMTRNFEFMDVSYYRSLHTLCNLGIQDYTNSNQFWLEEGRLVLVEMQAQVYVLNIEVSFCIENSRS